jgi:hypothetical protein
LSRLFSLDRGIRQGGILSPFLFAVYVDDALHSLMISGFGCDLYGLNLGALMYADDILLLAASLQHLQKLVNLTEVLLAELNLKINVKKCATMRVGGRCKVACNNLNLHDVHIPWVHELKYLGIVFMQAACLKINLHSNKVKFFYSFNNILAKLGNSDNIDTIVHLMKINCLSVLLFNLEAVGLSKTDINNLKFPVFRAYMKIFHIDDKDSVDWCMFYMHQLPIDLLIDARKVKFFNKMSKSDCYLMKHLFSVSARAQMLHIYNSHDVDNTITYNNFVYILWSKFRDRLGD